MRESKENRKGFLRSLLPFESIDFLAELNKIFMDLTTKSFSVIAISVKQHFSYLCENHRSGFEKKNPCEMCN